MKTHLIIGGTGQDGRYLSDITRKNDMRPVVTTRNLASVSKTMFLAGTDEFEILELDPYNSKQVEDLIDYYKPAYISNLTAQSSVGRSFGSPGETYLSCVVPNLNILEALRAHSIKSKYFHAASSDCFGDNTYLGNMVIPEKSPQSPYASAKVAASECLQQYCKHFDVKGFNGFLSNHESVLRGDDFVFPKIFKSVIKIRDGKQRILALGDLDIVRDWGSAEEFMRGVINYMVSEHFEDFILGTGVSMSLRSVVDRAFSNFNLDYRDFVVTDPGLCRSSEIGKMCGTIDFLRNRIGWVPTLTGFELIDKLQEDFERKIADEVIS